MRENELSLFGKICVSVLIALACIAAVSHIASGTVVRPVAFWIVIAGFVCFAIGKISVIARVRWVSLGTGLMSEQMANLYRLGYWLMAVGILATFL